MRKKLIYIKPINLVEEKEEKINSIIPVKTKESFSYFNNKTNVNMNDYYFSIISNKSFNSKINNQTFDNFSKSSLKRKNENKIEKKILPSNLNNTNIINFSKSNTIYFK